MAVCGWRVTMRGMNRLRLLWLCLLLVISGAVASVHAAWQDVAVEEAIASAGWTIDEERWYVIEIGGVKAGSMHGMVESDGALVRSTTRTRVKVGRGNAAVSVEMMSIFTETKDGRPVSLLTEERMSQQATHTTWTFGETSVMQETLQGGRVVKKEVALPEGAWLTPMAIERLWQKRLAEDAAEVSYRMIDGQSGMTPIDVKSVRVGSGEMESGGVKKPVTHWKTTNSLVPIEAVEWYDEAGVLVFQSMNVGVGDMVTRLATQEEAQAAASGDGPELMVGTFVRPDRAIEQPMRVTRATYRLTVKDGAMLSLPSAGGQRFEMDADGRSGLVIVDVNENQPAEAGDEADAAYREGSAMLDTSDPMLQKLAASAVRGAGDDVLKKSEAMRAFVHRHISRKNLGTAFATASETARVRSGDCSEHGVLLCALLRTQGIPARVATGLIYADQFAGEKDIFGWHMWTQALIDGRWVDLDATLPQRYSATHILTGVSSLADGSMAQEMGSMLLLMGNLKIEVVEVEHGVVGGGLREGAR